LLESEAEAHVPEQATSSSDNRPTINVPSLLASKDLHAPMGIVLVAMFVQQASGINAGAYWNYALIYFLTWLSVMYYSNDILSRVVPREAAAYTSLGITVLNAIMTFPAIFLVDVSLKTFAKLIDIVLRSHHFFIASWAKTLVHGLDAWRYYF
jgi:SP family facilitated glucose transporter-like MFS transporter 3